MIRTLAFLAIVAFAPARSNDPWNVGLHTEFSLIPFTGFNEFPRTLDDALEKGYKKVENPERSSGYSALDLYLTESDKNLISLYFDETKQVAGLCINLPKADVTSYFDMLEQGFTSWIYNSVDYWRTCIYFVSQDTQTRIDSTDPLKLIRHETLTVQGFNGTLDEIPITDEKIAAHANWETEGCMPMMGQHYYNKMTPDLTCNKPFYPWFLLTDPKTNQMTGLGLMSLGSTKSKLENPGLLAVKTIVPTAPQCLYDLVGKYGAFTMHIYFIDHPRLITC